MRALQGKVHIHNINLQFVKHLMKIYGIIYIYLDRLLFTECLSDDITEQKVLNELSFTRFGNRVALR